MSRPRRPAVSPADAGPAGAGGAASFAGRRRDRTTKPSVKLADRVAAALITVGGVGTIASIFGVGAVLVWQVVPLFWPGELAATEAVGDPAEVSAEAGRAEPLVDLRVDEFALIAAGLHADGRVVARRADDGAELGGASLRTADDAAAVTAVAAAFDGPEVALGFADGTVRLGTIDFDPGFTDAKLAPGERAAVEPAGSAAVAAVAEGAAGGLTRVQTLRVEPAAESIRLGDGPVRALDVFEAGGGPVVAGWSDGTGLVLWSGGAAVPLPMPPGRDLPRDAPAFVRIGDRAADVTAAWPDGTGVRFNTRNRANPRFAERVDFTPGGGTLTALAWVVGRGTLLAGDDAGHLTGWFPARTERSGDRSLTPAKRFGPVPGPVAAVRGSAAGRFAAVVGGGTARVVQTTTGDAIGEAVLPTTPNALFFTPREDRSFLYAALPPAADVPGLVRARFDPGHADATLASLFLPVWYEGGPGPEAKWQSTGGSVGVEAKFGLWPLIFGTLKATFYSMLFAAPLALLAAVYTGEFLPKGARAKIKPAVEVMAGLPSVVLGFVAAVTFSPFLSTRLVATLCAFVAVPAAVLVGAHLWQLLPADFTIRRRRWRLWLAALCLPAGVWLASAAAPAVEDALFAGDAKRWLDGRAGTPVGAWLFLTLPLSAIAAAYLSARFVSPGLVRGMRGSGRGTFAAVKAAGFAFTLLLTLGFALLAAWGLTAAGELVSSSKWDPRGEVVGTYQQRNAVVVGFAMAFTVIPIIYTLADDALASVPDSLRSASLGAGATVWQTATKVVVPAAMSGLFGAVMVGLGRAVGETMIVLMAAGATPITEFNPFSGFRTLASNLAIEVPEAVPGSTHYRTLFLAALLLFGMTFLVNTAAEAVRLAFRKRVSQI